MAIKKVIENIRKKLINLGKEKWISFFSIIFSVFLFWIMMTGNFWFLIWFCFAPAFFVVKREKIIPLFFFCILFVVLLNISSFYWFARYEIKILLISIFLMGLFGFFLCVFSKVFSFNRILEILCLPIIWTILVFLFSFNPLGSAWVNFAFFWPMMAPLIWYIKGIGITFLIILSNSLIAEYFYTGKSIKTSSSDYELNKSSSSFSCPKKSNYKIQRFFGKKDKKILVFILTLFLIVGLCFFYSYYGKTSGKELRVALVQGNIAETWEWRLNNVDKVLDIYENLTLLAIDEKPDFIIWSEYSVTSDLTKDKISYERINNLSKKINSTIILGTIIIPEESNNSKTLLKEKKDSVFVFSTNGEIINRYDTPFPMPFDELVLRGEKPFDNNIIKVNEASFIVGLCFEEILLERFRGKSDFIVTLVNNQIFDKTLGTELVSLFPKLIAAENKKYVLRTTNTGITEIINPYGKVVYKIEPFKEKILIGKIYI